MSLLRLGFDPWPSNFCMPQAQPKKEKEKKKKKTRKKGRKTHCMSHDPACGAKQNKAEKGDEDFRVLRVVVMEVGEGAAFLKPFLRR